MVVERWIQVEIRHVGSFPSALAGCHINVSVAPHGHPDTISPIVELDLTIREASDAGADEVIAHVIESPPVGRWVVTQDNRVQISVILVKEQTILCTTLLSVAVDDILEHDKVKGIVVPTSVADVGLVISVDPRDKEGFRQRLTKTFTQINPSRVRGVDTIISHPDADEISVYSRLYTKYHDAPEFALHGTYEERIIDMFEVYSLGSARAARALLARGEGRELELLARLACTHGPEPMELPFEHRLAAFCVERGVPQDDFTSMFERETTAAKTLPVRERERRQREFFHSLRDLLGTEPSPRVYSVKSSIGRITNDMIREILAASRATAPPSGGVRAYINKQFPHDDRSAAEGYRHLSSDEQRDIGLFREKMQSTESRFWPIGDEAANTIEEARRRMKTSSFVYDQAAQLQVTEPTSVTTAPKQPPSVSNELRASPRRVKSLNEQMRSSWVQSQLANLQRIQEYPTPSNRTLAASEGVGYQQPTSSRVGSSIDDVTHMLQPQHVTVPQPHVASESLPRQASSTSPTRFVQQAQARSVSVLVPPRSRSTEPPLPTAPSTLTVPSVSTMTDPVVNATEQPTWSAPTAAARPTVPAMAPHTSQLLPDFSVRMSQPSIIRPPSRPMTVASTQTNPWGDLPPAQRELFLLSDVDQSVYAWTTFIQAAEDVHNIPYHRLLYMTEAQFQRLCLEVGVPSELFRAVVSERQRAVLSTLNVTFCTNGSGNRSVAALKETVVHTSQRRLLPTNFRSIGHGAWVDHKTHQAVFRERLQRFNDPRYARHNNSSATTRDWGNTTRHSTLANAASSTRRLLLVRLVAPHTPGHTASSSPAVDHESSWDWVSYGVPGHPIRFYHNIWAAVRSQYRQLVQSCASLRSPDAMVPPPQWECMFDIMVCNVAMGQSVLQTTLASVPHELPTEFDSAIIGVGNDAEESTLIYNNQDIVVEALLLGCSVDSEQLGCENHPEVPSCFRKGQAASMLPTSLRRSLPPSVLLQLQDVPPLCSACLAVRAFLNADGVLSDRGPTSSNAPAATLVFEPTIQPTQQLHHENIPRQPTTSTAETLTTSIDASAFHSDRPKQLLNRAWDMWRRGSMQPAIAALERIPVDFPESSEASEAQGLLSELVDRHFVHAATHYREACRRNSHNTSAMYRLATVLETRLGDISEALRLYHICADQGDTIAARRVEELELFEVRDAAPSEYTPASRFLGQSSPSSLRPPVTAGSVVIPAVVPRRRF